MSIVAFYPATEVQVNIAAIGPNGDPIPTSAILIAGENSTGDLTPVSVDDNGAVNVSFTDFPTDLAKEAKQDDQITLATAGNASLTSIDSKLTSPLNVLGPLTDAELRASAVPISAASLPLPTGAATSALQTSGNTLLGTIIVDLTNGSQVTQVSGTVAVTGPLTDAQLRATPVPVSGTVSTGGLTDTELRASPVPVSVSGVATAANQATEIASLASIDSKLTSPLAVTGPLTDAQLRATPVPVSGTVSTGGLTDAQLRATPVPVSTGDLTDTQLRASPVPVSGTVAITAASLPLPTGASTEATLAALSAKTGAGFVPNKFDETVITYVGATTAISTVTYKLLGSTVALLTLTYDGSNRLIDVVKT